MAQTDEATIRQYLQMVQDSPDGNVPRRVSDALRREIDDLWRRIMVSPDTYIMTPLEFKLFNHYRAELQVRNARVVLKAVRRYWDSNQGDGTM
jgi:hypothetical protein